MKLNQKYIYLSFIAIIALLMISASSFAQQPDSTQGAIGLNPDRDQPLEITADHTLEWQRDNQQFIAEGNVIAKQGDVTIFADILTADYRDTGAQAFEIYRLTADGNVRIVSQGNTATGQKSVYDVDRGVAIMTGDNLLLSSPDQSVRARDSFEYWVTEGKLKAIGQAHVERLEDTLDAQEITAVFMEDPQGRRQLKSLSADGGVRITTPTEILTGSRGFYQAHSNVAEIIGNVKITRGPNVLEGERAEVNLATNVSKMIGNATYGNGQGKRVRGIFYPNSEKSQAPPEVAPNNKKPVLLGQ